MTDAEPNALSPTEQLVAICTERGERADLLGFPEADRVVRAAFLRALLLGLPFASNGAARICPVRAPGVRVTGARVEGPLDLTDCAGTDSGALPGLALEACDLTGSADLSNAHLTRLSLKDSCIHEVRLRGLRLAGPLDFAGVHGTTPASAAWIDAHGAIIRGEVRGNGAKLRVLQERKDVTPGQERYALRLSDAEIDGSVDLADGVEMIGGVTFRGVRIGGDFFAIGAQVEAGEGHALGAQAARIDGVMLLDRVNAGGVVWLLNAQIGGTLNCVGATLRNRTNNGGGYALVAANAEIGGDILLRAGFTAEGCVSLQGAKIGGSLGCDGATLRNRTDGGKANALVVDAAEIGGYVDLSGTFTAEGCIRLAGAKIGGFLSCNGATLRNRTNGGEANALVADAAEIGGYVSLSDTFTAEGCVSLLGARIGGSLNCAGAMLRNRSANGLGKALVAEDAEILGAVLLRGAFMAEGCVSLLGAKIGRDLECSTARLRNEASIGTGFSLVLQDARIGGRIRLDQGFVSLGRIILWGCHIGGDLICTSAQFVGPPPPSSWGSRSHLQSAVDAINLRVEGDVILDEASVIGSLTFEHARIAGSLRWDWIAFPRQLAIEWPGAAGKPDGAETLTWTYAGRAPATPDAVLGEAPAAPARLNLAHAHIEAALRAYRLTTGVNLGIDLSATRVHTLDDVRDGDDAADFLEGWGGTKGTVRLDLDGFVYDRIEHFPTRKENTPLTALLSWFGHVLAALLRVLSWPVRAGLRRPWAAAAQRLERRVEAFADWTRRVFGGEAGIAGGRLMWLERGAPGPGKFYPQPYRQLASVMRVQGHLDAARLVAVAEQDNALRSGWSAFWRPMFGLCFGHGLKPVNATMTLLVLLMIGTGLVWSAWKIPAKNSLAAQRNEFVLVLTPTGIAAKSAEESLAGQHLLRVVDRRCDKHDIMPLFYALDMMLPVIPLHQEDRCEVASRAGTEGWQIAWAVFSIIGKIVTSLTLLTYAGVLKSREE